MATNKYSVAYLLTPSQNSYIHLIVYPFQAKIRFHGLMIGTIDLVYGIIRMENCLNIISILDLVQDPICPSWNPLLLACIVVAASHIVFVSRFKP